MSVSPSGASLGAPATAEALTPVAFLQRSATLYPSAVAVVDGARRTTYRDWYSRVRREAGLLKAVGASSGDRVAVLAPNGHMLLDSHYGVPMAGGVLVTLNIRLTPADLNHIVAHAGAQVLLFDESLADIAALLDVPVKISAAEYEQLQSQAEELEVDVRDEYSLFALNYTSGTIGRPKGVMYHHRGAYLQALAMAFHTGLSTSSVHLWPLPMFHCNGWTFQ
jgi:fatty-acyl-CoA synthase